MKRKACNQSSLSGLGFLRVGLACCRPGNVLSGESRAAEPRVVPRRHPQRILGGWVLVGLLAQASVTAGVTWKSVEGIEGVHFDIGGLAGVFVAQDHRQLAKGFGRHGVRDLSFKGHDLRAPGPPLGGRRRHQGLLNLYRVYSSTESFGSLRDEQAELSRLPDGARLTWPASPQRPVAISGTWQISGPAQIDLQVEATPTRPLHNLEVLTALYLPVPMRNFVYLQRSVGIEPHDVRPSPAYGDPLNYPFFPTGEKARTAQSTSGRVNSSWKWRSVTPPPPNAWPMVFAENDELQLVLMGERDNISAVCATPVPITGDAEDWNSVEQHAALYFSIFGFDVEPGVAHTARIRLVVIDKPIDSSGAHLQLYDAFLADR